VALSSDDSGFLGVLRLMQWSCCSSVNDPFFNKFRAHNTPTLAISICITII
jgi:hypothetical protein